MKGLLIKDFLILKNQGKLLALALLVYSIIAFSSGNADMVTTMLFVVSVIMPVTAIAYDEKSRWERYALATALNRRDLVLSKYLFGGLCIVCGMLLGILFTLAAEKGSAAVLLPRLRMLVVAACVGVVVQSVNLPIVFNFGVEKGRIAMLLVIAGTAALQFYLGQVGIQVSGSLFSNMPLVLYVVIAAVSFGLSIVVSNLIYSKKEF